MKEIKQIPEAPQAWLALMLVLGQDQARVFVNRILNEEGYVYEVARHLVGNTLQERAPLSRSAEEKRGRVITGFIQVGECLYPLPDPLPDDEEHQPEMTGTPGSPWGAPWNPSSWKDELTGAD